MLPTNVDDSLNLGFQMPLCVGLMGNMGDWFLVGREKIGGEGGGKIGTISKFWTRVSEDPYLWPSRLYLTV